MKKKLLQIDSCLNMLSTGRISESIGKLAIERGWETFIMHGARNVRPGSCMHSIQVGNKLSEYLHYAEGLLLDNHGLAARNTTRPVIELIKEIKPDVVQLHCLHGYYINYKLLFEYLNTTNIPVVWTFHDCWAFTGHCAYPVSSNCDRWKKEGCHDCPNINGYPKAYFDFSRRNYNIKKELFSANKNLHIVAVSEWLAADIRDSFLSDKDIRVIQNGIDIELFYPCANKKNEKFTILDVASAWGKRKGLYDFYKVREALPEDKYDIILVGLSEQQIKNLPRGIKGISKTNSVEDLARLYSEANVFVNPTYADSFPTVNMEALACGVPVITYKTGGSPEIINDKTGVVVEQGDIVGLVKAIIHMQEKPLSAEDCRKRAVDRFDKEKRFMDYVNLYESLI